MTLLEKIKDLFKSEEATQEVVENNFADAKTNDGRILRVAEDKVTEITEEGEVALEDGEYTLEDGTILVVKGGLIVEKKEATTEEATKEEAPVEAPAEEEMAEDMPEGEVEVEVEAPAEEEKSLEDRISALEEALAIITENLGKKKEEMEAVVSELEATKEENEALKLENENLSKVPVAEPVKTAKFEKIIGASSKTNTVNEGLLNKISALRENVK